MDITKQCAIYARSRHLGAGGVADQILSCRAAVEANGWSVEEQDVYYDSPHESAMAIGKRPGIQGLLKRANDPSRNFNTVVVSDPARLSRKVQDILGIYVSLAKVGVDIRVVDR